MAETALRPRTVLELLDASLALMRRDYFKYVTIMAIVSLPNVILMMLWVRSLFSLSTSAGPEGMTTALEGMAGLGLTIIPFFVWLIWYPFVDAALIAAASEAYMGREVNVGAALRTMLSRFWSILGIVLLRAGAILLGGILLVIPGVYAFLRYYLAQGVSVLETTRPVASMSRSAELTKGFKGKILATLFLVYVIYNCLALLPIVPVMFLGNIAILTSLGVLMGILLYPMYPITATLLYYDIRIRKEGFDIELLARELGQLPSTQAAD